MDVEHIRDAVRDGLVKGPQLESHDAIPVIQDFDNREPIKELFNRMKPSALSSASRAGTPFTILYANSGAKGSRV